MCHRRHPPTMMACFVTAEGNDLKLGTCVPLGDLYLETKLWQHTIPGSATRGLDVKNRKNVITPLIMTPAGLIFYGRYSYWGDITYHPGFQFDLHFKVTEVKVRCQHRPSTMVARFVTA